MNSNLRMRFIPRRLTKKLLPKNGKKTILGTFKTGTKLIGAGLLMGAGAEVTGHISSKATETEDGAQFITITDLRPSIARFDSVDANTDGSKAHWFPSTRNPLTLGIPTFALAVFIVLTFKCCWRRLRCLHGLCRCWTPPEKPDHTPHPSSPPCDAVDMEAEMERLERQTHNPVVVQEDSHYSTPAKQLQEVIKNVNESAVNCARIAHYNDSLHQQEEAR